MTIEERLERLERRERTYRVLCVLLALAGAVAVAVTVMITAREPAPEWELGGGSGSRWVRFNKTTGDLWVIGGKDSTPDYRWTRVKGSLYDAYRSDNPLLKNLK